MTPFALRSATACGPRFTPRSTSRARSRQIAPSFRLGTHLSFGLWIRVALAVCAGSSEPSAYERVSLFQLSPDLELATRPKGSNSTTPAMTARVVAVIPVEVILLADGRRVGQVDTKPRIHQTVHQLG